MKKITFTLLAVSAALCVNAQALKEKKGVRIIEHHSSSINKGAPFGSGANGNYAGYDFVKHEFKSSFNPSNMGKWSAAEAANLDMVEHNGPFGNRGGFGFTSATSSIWGGDIVGNGTTTLHPAPSGFNYDTIKDVKTIKAAHPIVIGGNTVMAAQVGKVYVCRITRQKDYWVAMKITKVQNLPTNYRSGDTTTVYFEFDYKYGTVSTSTTGVDDVAAEESFSVTPNPSNGIFRLNNIPAQVNMQKAVVRVTDIAGKTVYTQPASTGSINLNLQPGVYMVNLTDGSYTSMQKLVIQ